MECEERSWHRASRDVPLIVQPHLLRARPRWRAVFIASHGTGIHERALTGRSFGLAIGVASASLLLVAPVPPDAIAIAEIDNEGVARRVDSGGLARKLHAIREYGLGVGRILVALDQREEAQGFVSDACQVIGVRTLREAITLLWPDAVERARTLWKQAALARAALDTVYRMALENSVVVLDWAPLASSSALLREMHRDDASIERAEFAYCVAKRHTGPIDQPIAWSGSSWPSDVPHPDWLRKLAHAIQSQADSGVTAPECIEAAERGLKEVAPPGRRHPADFELLGAIGRTLAAAGQYSRATEVLRDALKGWRELDRPNEASYPICELVRVLAISGTVAELDAAIAEYVIWMRRPPVDNQLDVSACFIALAVGRALITVGELKRGLDELTDASAPWDHAPPHVRYARLRWMARGFSASGAPMEAKKCRQRIEAACAQPENLDPNLHLARLDDALEHGIDPSAHITELMRGGECREFQRLESELRQEAISGTVSPNELAQRLSVQYRY